LSGARFDFKVEFAGLADPSKISITLNGKDYAQVFGKAGTFVEREAGKDQSALLCATFRSGSRRLQHPRHGRS
jgi:alkaline phosphatase